MMPVEMIYHKIFSQRLRSKQSLLRMFFILMPFIKVRPFDMVAYCIIMKLSKKKIKLYVLSIRNGIQIQKEVYF